MSRIIESDVYVHRHDHDVEELDVCGMGAGAIPGPASRGDSIIPLTGSNYKIAFIQSLKVTIEF